MIDACIKWSSNIRVSLLDKTKLKQIIEHPSFKEICAIDAEVKAEHQGTGLSGFLLESVDRHHSEFLIPYAFLTHEVPEEYSRIHIGLIGVSADLPQILHSLENQ